MKGINFFVPIMVLLVLFIRVVLLHVILPLGFRDKLAAADLALVDRL